MALINQASLNDTDIRSLDEILLALGCFNKNGVYTIINRYVGLDWTHTIFKGKEGLIGLIETDHPSPFYDAKELAKLSGEKYTFNSIYPIKGGRLIKINKEEEYAEDFFIHKKSTYRYCVEIKTKGNGIEIKEQK